MRFTNLAYASVVFAFFGCGNKVTSQPPPPGGGVGNDLSMSGGSDDGGSDMAGNDLALADGGVAVVDMAGFNMTGAPVVTITSPAAGTEVPGDSLTVTAKVTSPTGMIINASTVAITITPPGSGVVTQIMTAAGSNTYSGTISTAAVPSGNATFTVSASDISGNSGSATGTYVHDHGPTITFVQPSAATAHGTIAVDVIVDDPLHPITMVSQVQAGIRAPGDITLMQVSGAVPFEVEQPSVDVSALDGPQVLTVTATNSKGTKQTAQKQFTVDNSGPTIVINSPAAGSFVGGVTQVSAKIDDISGVNASTVVAEFGGNPSFTIPLTQMASGSDIYVGYFDVRTLGKSYVYADVSIRADDTLGNHGELGEQVIVDNTPPFLTMDGAYQMRVAKRDSTGGWECSQLFNPLGPASDNPASEGETVSQVITLRARIEDRGNSAPGQIAAYESGLDPSSVTLFAIPFSSNEVLAVDTDGDGYCDDVNPTLIPTTNVTMSGQALALAMAPMANGAGTPDYRQGGTVPTQCTEVGDSSTTVAPQPICQVTDNISYMLSVNDTVAPIWTIGPVSANVCAGFQVDSANHLPPGPTCVIARASDKAGNHYVSWPLHICINSNNNSGNCPHTFAATDCTGLWNKMTQTTSGTCKLPVAADPGVANPTTFPTSGTEIRLLVN